MKAQELARMKAELYATNATETTVPALKNSAQALSSDILGFAIQWLLFLNDNWQQQSFACRRVAIPLFGTAIG